VAVAAWVVPARLEVRAQRQLAGAGAVLPELDEEARARFGREIILFDEACPDAVEQLIAHRARTKTQVGRDDTAAIQDAENVERGFKDVEVRRVQAIADARTVEVDFGIEVGTELLAQSKAVIPVVILQ
jgi:hypothetical protein